MSFIRYVLNCCFVLGVKMLATTGLTEVVDGMVAYALALAVTSIVSYFLHSRLTFSAKYSLSSFLRYFRTLAVFNGVDYLMFSVLFKIWDVQAPVAVLCASIAIFLFRFFAVKKVLVVQ